MTPVSMKNLSGFLSTIRAIFGRKFGRKLVANYSLFAKSLVKKHKEKTITEKAETLEIARKKPCNHCGYRVSLFGGDGGS